MSFPKFLSYFDRLWLRTYKCLYLKAIEATILKNDICSRYTKGWFGRESLERHQYAVNIYITIDSIVMFANREGPVPVPVQFDSQSLHLSAELQPQQLHIVPEQAQDQNRI